MSRPVEDVERASEQPSVLPMLRTGTQMEEAGAIIVRSCPALIGLSPSESKEEVSTPRRSKSTRASEFSEVWGKAAPLEDYTPGYQEITDL